MGLGFRSRRWLTLTVMTALVMGAVSWLVLRPDPRHISDARTMSSSPPPPGGYFRLVPAGRWRTLPSYDVCEGLVHYSTWEPRPDNYKRNYAIPDAAAVHRALEARPRAVRGAYDPRSDSWLVPRIDGQFAGTTDEIFQWAACKWGLPDDLLRAIAVRESTWYQYETYPAGRCVNHFGCGDVFTTASPTSRVFCRALARYGYDYQRDYGPGKCPKTFSIMTASTFAWPHTAVCCLGS